MMLFKSYHQRPLNLVARSSKTADANTNQMENWEKEPTK